MIRAEFRLQKKMIAGFAVSGHAGAGEAGNDIVCAAVSSAVYLTANTITDVIAVPARVRVDDGGRMRLSLETEDLPVCQTVLRGLELHLKSLSQQYPANLTIGYRED